MPGVAVFGGTFDPIHIGHLRSAIEIKHRLGQVEVRLVPSNIPPHREIPAASAEQRLQMLRLAVDGVEGLVVDRREIDRPGKSFMIDTLADIRRGLGAEVPLYLVLGKDAYQRLDQWYEWRALTDFAHLVILNRPGAEYNLDPAVSHWAKNKQVRDLDQLSRYAKGAIVEIQLSQLEISATKIRDLCQRGEPIDFLVPKSVQAFITTHALYRANCA